MSETPFKDLIAAAARAKFDVIPAADYPAVCTQATGVKSSTGKPMIKFKHKVAGGAYAGNNLIGQQTLSAENDAAVAIFLKFLDAHGIDKDTLLSLPPDAEGGPNMGAVASLMQGKPVVCTVSVGQWQGEDRNYVDKCRKPTEAEKAEIEAWIASGASAAGGPPPASSDPFASAKPADPMAGKPAEDPF